MVPAMWMLLFACTGGPEPLEPVEPVEVEPTQPDGRIPVTSPDAEPKDVLGAGWSVTYLEPTWDTTYTVQVKEHQGAFWCYESFTSGKNLTLFKHGSSAFPAKEDWVDYKDVADEILMPDGGLDGATIYGYAWPSEAKDEAGLKALARKRAESYETWLKKAFASPLKASVLVRVEIPPRTYPQLDVVTNGSAMTSWELDPEAQTVAGAQLVLQGARPDTATVRAVEFEDISRFGRAVERLGNVAKDPTGDNPKTLRVNAGDITYTAMSGSGSWEDVADQLLEVCATSVE